MHSDPPPRHAELAVVCVNFGSHRLLEANLGAQVLPAGTVVVIVDNRSSDAERVAIRRLCDAHSWNLVELPDNAGFGGGMNAGMRRAAELGCDVFLLLNPDASVSSEVITQLHEHSVREPRSLISPRIVNSAGRTVYGGSQVDLRTGHIAGIPTLPEHDAVRVDGQVPGPFVGPVQGWLPGACLIVHRTMFDLLGGFDEPYFLYWEDVDLCRRAELAGGALVLRRDLVAVHDEGGTHGEPGSRSRSPLYYRYNCRNRLLFAARHLPRRGVLRWMWHTPRESWQILLRGGRRQLLHSPRPLLATVAGSLAGLLLAARALLRPRPDRAAARTPRTRSVLIAHPSAELYGSDRVMLETATALVAAGADVTVALPGAGELVEHIRQAGATPVQCPMPVLRKSALRPRGFLRLLADGLRGLPPAVRLIRSAGRDVVYVSTVTIPLWPVLARLLGRRVVCHVHEAESAAPRPVQVAMNLPLRAAQRIVVNSEYSLTTMLAALPGLRARSAVVLNPVPGPADPAAPRTELTGPVELLYLGRLSPRKGTDVAVAAVAELVRRGCDVRLTVVGSAFTGYEWFTDQLHEQTAAAGLADRVGFVGFEPSVWPRIAASDVVLVPSVADEPFGNTAVEAVLGARPLVVSRTSGLREAAAGYRSAVFVAPGDPAAVADAVTAIVEDWAQYRKLAVAESENARERHAAARYRERIARILL